MDLTTLTDEQLTDHLNAVLAEQERRQRLAAVPEQIVEMAARYVADGGDRGDLIEAVTGPPTADTTE
ncbi:hypothetical protein [Microbacterium testaceum]|uniref:Uncharacterized protein n=1 Tax=Microbacterium testaceum TaxID=2033 RepID=A0A147F4V3_MICTE|nr:hypothetical protein [Microbacterium testaceum]KTS09024.1 hypothetical protein RSA3_14060 [Microbacterium testaceum]